MGNRVGSAALALLLGGCAAARGARPQEVQWFRSGPYAGGSLGVSNAHGSASELDSQLAELGHTTMSTLDDTDSGWKVHLGYRFERPFAIEVGYVELGQVTSTIQVTTSDLDQFLEDVADVHPALGSGPFLVGQYSPYDHGRVELGLRAGVWLPDSEIESKATVPGGEIDIEQDSFDPLLGLVFLCEITRWLELRLEYEKYWIDGEDADFVSVGLQGKVLR
jgi:hypothetical protein